jgi:predicted transcriptional regulator of viral defense system
MINAFPKSIRDALKIFQENDGILRTQEAIKLGINPKTLYTMASKGLVKKLSRGVFILTAQETSIDPDFLAIAKRYPKAVICLSSALHHYGLLRSKPNYLHIALPQGTHHIQIDDPPIKSFYLQDEVYSMGIEVQQIGKVTVKIYDVEKTIADCFKFRNKIGEEIAFEAIKNYYFDFLIEKDFEKLYYYGEINKVSSHIRTAMSFLQHL